MKRAIVTVLWSVAGAASACLAVEAAYAFLALVGGE